MDKKSVADPSAEKLTRHKALGRLIVLPALAAILTETTLVADAADNKKQFKYQNKPGKNGQKCSGCRLFKPPASCQVVTGTFSPNGWCIAWVAK